MRWTYRDWSTQTVRQIRWSLCTIWRAHPYRTVRCELSKNLKFGPWQTLVVEVPFDYSKFHYTKFSKTCKVIDKRVNVSKVRNGCLIGFGKECRSSVTTHEAHRCSGWSEKSLRARTFLYITLFSEFPFSTLHGRPYDATKISNEPSELWFSL